MSGNATPDGGEHGVAEMTAPPMRDLPSGRHEFHKEQLMSLIDAESHAPTVTPAAKQRPLLLRPRFAFPALAAATVAAVAAVTVPAIVSPSPVDRAIASWTPKADEVTGAQVLLQANACARNWGAESAQASDVLIAEQRGDTTSMIMKVGAELRECTVTGDDEPWGWQSLAAVSTPAPAPGTVLTETWDTRGSDGNSISKVVGRVGDGITGIDVVLNNGTTIKAMSAGGWWTAWWPGTEGGESAFTVAVHTAAGTRTHRPYDINID